MKAMGLMYLYFHLKQRVLIYRKERILNDFMTTLSLRFKEILAWLPTEQLSSLRNII